MYKIYIHTHIYDSLAFHSTFLSRFASASSHHLLFSFDVSLAKRRQPSREKEREREREKERDKIISTYNKEVGKNYREMRARDYE